MVSSSFLDMTAFLSNGVRANTAAEAQWLASLPPELQASMSAQLQMHREQELLEIANQIIKRASESGKTLLRNIGG